MRRFLKWFMPILTVFLLLTLPIGAEERICGGDCVLPIEAIGIPCDDEGDSYTEEASLPALYASPAEPVKTEYYYRSLLQSMEDGDSLVYAYDALVDGYKALKKEISITDGVHAIGTKDVKLVFYSVEYDHPEIFWVGNSYRYTYSESTGMAKTVMPNYTMSVSKISESKVVLEATVEDFLAKVEGMTDQYQIVKTLHDLILDKGVYGNSVHAHDVYGILVDGVGVCESYAKAFQYLLQRAGIQTAIVTGQAGELHAWCVVNVDGKFYHNDITWADAGVTHYYGYFNISTDVLSDTHTPTPFVNSVVYPVCDSMDAAYFIREGGALNELTVEALADEIKRQGNVTRVFDLSGDEPISEWMDANVSAAINASGLPWVRCVWRYTRHECILTIIPPASSMSLGAGKLGSDMTWQLSGDGVLRIEGKGAMPDFGSYTEVPWYSLRAFVTRIQFGQDVVGIGDYAFYGCERLESVTVSDNVRTIGDYAFAGCDRMTSLTLPKKLESIGDRAFFYCPRITSLTIPRGTKNIGECAFLSCNGLNSVTFEVTDGWMMALEPSGLWQNLAASTPSTNARNLKETYFEYYWKRVQEGSAGLVYSINVDRNSYSVKGIGTCTDTHIVIPKTYNGIPVTQIGKYAFAESGIVDITLPDGLLKIGDYAFENCKSLTALHIPKSVKEIGRFAIYGCDALETLEVDAANTSLQSINGCVISMADKCLVAVCPKSVIPTDGSVIAIGAYSLAGYGKRALVIPAAVTEIDEGAFACLALTELSVAEGNTVYHGKNNCVIHTAEKMLVGAAESFELPDDGSVEKIGAKAFFGNDALESVVIPAAVAEIGKNAFYGCVRLREITYMGSEKDWAQVVKGNAWDKNTGDYSVTCAKTPTLTIIDEDCRAGDTIDLDFVVSNLPAFQALGFYNLEYDASAIEIVSGTWLMNDTVMADFDVAEAVAVMTYEDVRTASGVVFRLTVRVKDRAEDGTYELNCGRVSLDGDDTTVTVVPAKITVTNMPRGDLTEDGKVSANDAIWCLRHVLFGNKFPVRGDIDFNGDGAENVGDAIHLLRFVLFADKFPLS